MGTKKMGSKKIGTKIHFLGRNAFVLLLTFMFLCFGSVAYAAAPTNISLSTNTVPENEPAATTVGTFTTVDPDSGDTHTYSLVAGDGDTDNASFAIVDDQLQTAAVFDYEDQSIYNIRVCSTDSGDPAELFEKQFTINVTDVNDAPVISGQVSLSTPEETDLTIILTDLTVTDPDNNYPADFTLSVQDGTAYTRIANTITPDVDFSGDLTVPVTVNDGISDSNTYYLTVTITPVNDAPTAVNDLFSVLEDSTNNTLNVLQNDTDPDSGDTLTIMWVGTPNSGGTVEINGNVLTYEPLSDFNGQETFDYTIQDAAGEPSTTTVTVNVFETNETPIARNDYFTMYEDTVSNPSWNVTAANPQDPDELGDEPSIINPVSDPNNGTLVLNADGTFTYTPFADWCGDDTFT